MFLSLLAFILPSHPITIKLGFAASGLAVLLAVNTPLYATEKTNTVPCDIKLVFGIDDQGMSIVSYDLEMQINNKQGRTIRGVSVHWLNAQSEIIGNSDAACEPQHSGIKLGQAGTCHRIIQKIGGRLLEQLGQETWTSIINSEMYNYQAVKSCAIIGYRYGNSSVNRY